MPNRMLKFIELGSRAPDKRGAETRREDFVEIYQEFDPAAAAAQAGRCSQSGMLLCTGQWTWQKGIPHCEQRPAWAAAAAGSNSW